MVAEVIPKPVDISSFMTAMTNRLTTDVKNEMNKIEVEKAKDHISSLMVNKIGNLLAANIQKVSKKMSAQDFLTKMNKNKKKNIPLTSDIQNMSKFSSDLGTDSMKDSDGESSLSDAESEDKLSFDRKLKLQKEN